MKNLTKTALCPALLVAPAMAQVAWDHQGPLPTGRDVEDIFLLSRDEAWAVGDYGHVMHTLDGGITWTKRVLPNSPSLNAVWFEDAQTGWVAGNEFWYTVDGGATWTLAAPWGTIYDLFFVDATHGWACGNGGGVYYSDDGGQSWSWTLPPGAPTLGSIFFHDPQNGWVAGGGKLYRSSDGGRTWSLAHEGINTGTVWFADYQEGWITGTNTVLHTVDGGATWQPLPVPPGTWVYSSFFLDAQHSWSVGEGSNVVGTTDGWQTSATQLEAGEGPRLWNVFFVDEDFGMAVGERGRILVTGDGGQHWMQRDSAGTGIYHMDVNDAAHAWVALVHGDVARTTNGGARWEAVHVDGISTFGYATDVDFSDNQHGWATGRDVGWGGSRGVIARSTDGGRTWKEQYSTGDYLDVIAALDAQTAVVCGTPVGSQDVLLRTEDGGLTWDDVAPGGGIYTAIDFADDQHGWVAGYSIHGSTDGGRSWSFQYQPLYTLMGISFADSDNGWAVGWYGTLLHTTDGGQTWERQSSSVIGDTTLLAACAVDADTAWVVGHLGFAARTTNGGRTWQKQTVPFGWGFPKPSFSTVAFLDADFGWIAGDSLDRGGLWRRSNGSPPGFSLLHGRLSQGDPVELEVTGAQPGEPIFFGLSAQGTGQGPCFAVLGGLCLDLLPPLTLLGASVADGSGSAALTATVPSTAPYVELYFQAVAFSGPFGTASVKSNTTASWIEP